MDDAISATTALAAFLRLGYTVEALQDMFVRTDFQDPLCGDVVTAYITFALPAATGNFRSPLAYQQLVSVIPNHCHLGRGVEQGRRCFGG